MGNTQAKLSAVPQQSRRNANCNTRKRRASPAPLDTNNKRCAIAIKAEDTDHTREDLPSVPNAKKPCGPLRDSLDADEQFLELPQLFDLVGVVAKKHGVDDGPLHRSYRGLDVLTSLEKISGLRHISYVKSENLSACHCSNKLGPPWHWRAAQA